MNSFPTVIDCEYVHPQYAGAYLLVENKRALFVENNTARAAPLLLKALKQKGLTPEQVEYLIITHVHLDHAGGTSALMEACPNATLLAHPKAARHMIDPTKLVQSARAVYGDANFEKLYGQISPVSPDRVREIQDGESIDFGSRRLHFIYTRGHANHHFCIYDSGSEGVFTGDSFGLAYPVLQKNGLFIFPSTSPTDFDPKEARISIRKILETGAKQAYLTHFGAVNCMKDAADQLLEHLNYHEKLLEEAVASDQSDKEIDLNCKTKLYQYFERILLNRGLSTGHDTLSILGPDIELNAAGIAYAALKKRKLSN